MSQLVDRTTAAPIASGLLGGLGDDPSDEQQRMFEALAAHLLRLDPAELAALAPLWPAAPASALPGAEVHRRFVQPAIVLELYRHPRSDARSSTGATGSTCRGPGRPLPPTTSPTT